MKNGSAFPFVVLSNNFAAGFMQQNLANHKSSFVRRLARYLTLVSKNIETGMTLSKTVIQVQTYCCMCY